MKNLRFISLLFLVFIFASCSKIDKKVRINFLEDTRPVILVLGGGGARAMAHLGAIEILEKNNIPIDIIVGTSGGSIAGAIYADRKNIAEAKSTMFKYKANEILDISLMSAFNGIYTPHVSIIDGKKFEKSLYQNIKAKNFSDLKIPFVAVATDIKNGKAVGINNGNVARAVRASCAIPGLFSPVIIDNHLYVDGCVAEPLPTLIAKKYNPKLIIAIDVNIKSDYSKIANLLDLSYKSYSITYDSFNNLLASNADIIIKPDTKDIGMFDDHRKEELYQAGQEAAEKMLPRIKEALGLAN